MFLIPITFILMGAMFLALGRGFLKDYKKLSSEKFEVISGRISDIIEEREHSAGDITYSYHPVIDFMYRSTSHSVKSKISVKTRKSNKRPNGKSFAIGDLVDIRIYNADVNTVFINSKSIVNSSKKIGLVFLTIGIIMVISGLLLTVVVIEEIL